MLTGILTDNHTGAQAAITQTLYQEGKQNCFSLTDAHIYSGKVETRSGCGQVVAVPGFGESSQIWGFIYFFDLMIFHCFVLFFIQTRWQ